MTACSGWLPPTTDSSLRRLAAVSCLRSALSFCSELATLDATGAPGRHRCCFRCRCSLTCAPLTHGMNGMYERSSAGGGVGLRRRATAGAAAGAAGSGSAGAGAAGAAAGAAR